MENPDYTHSRIGGNQIIGNGNLTPNIHSRSDESSSPPSNFGPGSKTKDATIRDIQIRIGRVGVSFFLESFSPKLR